MTPNFSGAFQLPAFIDLGATFAFALTGAIAGIKRGYDFVGVFFLALASGLGGGLIRDGIFLSGTGPTPLLTDARYIEVVTVATLVGAVFSRSIVRFHRFIAVVDALGLGAYAAFGAQKALQAGLAVPATLLVGVINAAGGGLLRDLLTREEPLVFRPGQFYVVSAFAGAVTFVFLTRELHLAAIPAAFAAIATSFLLRALSISLNWRTAPVGVTEIATPTPGPGNRNI